ncbi:MAG: DUF2089 domain-containing protein [Chloroflexi bacterium]|uniref:DUF2089 domain-containing protein n=1 Tax=Candidatus Chlorohelix allophototropha TaxID=3003348 RepID=A0A8T7M0D6_9CHLR|nr:DUF2089 domain-containing protein [Chloroflexota bacterium]WJW67136.1 DUF2089 domain-containing protein [Chloroflexota bacterium L227-S17]
MVTSKCHISGQCPVCNEQMHITRLECENCGSGLDGKFSLGSFQNLSPDQLQFLEVFIRARGQNKAIQELLNISYPTVIKKLDELIVALGYEPVPLPDSRREILEMLSQGKITAAQAQQLMATQKLTDNSDNRAAAPNTIGE